MGDGLFGFGILKFGQSEAITLGGATLQTTQTVPALITDHNISLGGVWKTKGMISGDKMSIWCVSDFASLQQGTDYIRIVPKYSCSVLMTTYGVVYPDDASTIPSVYKYTTALDLTAGTGSGIDGPRTDAGMRVGMKVVKIAFTQTNPLTRVVPKMY